MQDFTAQRRSKLKKLLKKNNVDAILVTNIVNVSYLSGFTGSSAYLLVSADKEILISDSRYTTQISEECSGLEIEIRTARMEMVDSVAKVIKNCGLKSLAVEADSLTKVNYDLLESKLAPLTFVGVGGWVQQLRAIKDKSEIAAIEKSIRVNQRAFEVIRAQLTPDQSERDVAFNLEHQMRQFGATECSFDPIVGVGPRAALPHGVPSDKKIGESPFVLIDWGAKVGRYASDLTRVLVTSKIPPKLRKIYNIVLKAQLAAIRKIKPGVSLKEVDRAARSVIDSAGYGKYFGHGLGHGFGLEIHETPFISPIKDGTLQANMVVTVEPGIYLPDWGGVRIEDDVLVTKDGHRVMSDLPKNIEDCVVDMS